MKTCPEHDKPFSPKSPNSKGYYWHVINFDKDEYCSKTKEEYNALPDENENPTAIPNNSGRQINVPSNIPTPQEPVREPIDAWQPIKENETRAMLTMSKLKAKEYALEAAGRVASALISRPDFTLPVNPFNLVTEYAKTFEKYLLPESSAQFTKAED